MIDNMLASWRAKYGIPNLIELVVHEPSNRVDALLVECVALNFAILNAGLKLHFPRVLRKFLFIMGYCPNLVMS